jgi:hypothetical protein
VEEGVFGWFENTGEGKADTGELSGGEPERVQTTKSSEYTVSSWI